MPLTTEQQTEMLTLLINGARAQPNRSLPIIDASGATVATLTVHDLPKRPKDMPRHMRPKQKLSYRERRAAKLGKLKDASRVVD